MLFSIFSLDLFLIFGREEECEGSKKFGHPFQRSRVAEEKKEEEDGRQEERQQRLRFTLLHGIEFIPFHSIHRNDNPIFRACVCVFYSVNHVVYQCQCQRHGHGQIVYYSPRYSSFSSRTAMSFSSSAQPIAPACSLACCAVFAAGMGMQPFCTM